MKATRSKISLMLLLTACAAQQVSAQNYTVDAAKFGQYSSFATARSVGFGGALGSVGGDFASLSVNPAGIGIYRSSEFMFTPGLRFSSNDAKYTGASTSDNNVRFGINNLGVVFTETASKRNYDKAAWKATSFGIGLNRVADFNRSYVYSGNNATSSGSFYFEDDAILNPQHMTGDQSIGTPAYLGYQSYLLSGSGYSYVPYTSGLNQTTRVQVKGGVTEMALTGGANYMDKLMLGATLGIDFFNHKVDRTYSEKTLDAKASDSFDNYSYNEHYHTSGAGVNLKLGAIYKFNNYFRLGAAFHTPTVYSFNETGGNSITTASYGFGTNSIQSPDYQYEYSYSTPMKAILSATGMLGKYGFVSVDYEYVTYGTMRYFMDDKVAQNAQNDLIKALCQSASNVRAGVELRYEGFMVRGGYGMYGSPFKNESYQGKRTDISFGLGYRFENMFLDLGIVNSRYKTFEQPYILNEQYYTPAPTASIDNSLTSGVLTVGWKF